MKGKQSARRLLALTLATAVTIPQTGSVFATSLKVGTAGEDRLRQTIQATKTNRGMQHLSIDPDRLLSMVTTKDVADDRILTSPVKDVDNDRPTSGLDVEESPVDADFQDMEVSAATTDTAAGKTEEKENEILEVEIRETIAVETNTAVDNEMLDGQTVDLAPAGTVEGSVVPSAEDESRETSPEADNGVTAGETPIGGGLTGEKENGASGAREGASEGSQASEPPQEAVGAPSEEAPEAAEPDADPLPSLEQVELEAVTYDGVMRAAAKPVGDLNIYNYSLGFGIQIWPGNALNLSLGFLDYRFGIERPEDYQYTDYGDRYYAGNRVKYDVVDGNTYSYCRFPSETELGRVPDKQFGGWYLYGYGVKGDDPDSNLWNYDSDYEAGLELIPLEGMTAVDGTPLELAPYDRDNSGDLWDQYSLAYSKYGYKTVKENGGKSDSGNPVSMVGRWMTSNESRAADAENPVTLTVKTTGGAVVSQSPTLYGSEIGNRPLAELEDEVTTFDRGSNGGTQEYWLRVAADVATMDLEFNAYEIYYDYHMDAYDAEERPDGKRSPVQVTYSFPGQETETYSDTERLSHRMLPEWGEINGYYIAKNSLADPAHSLWTVEGIELKASTSAEDYNDITITVTSPSGDVTTTYIFHVQRLADPTIVQNPGNTPVGMIQRDPTVIWGVTEEEKASNKKAAIEAFKQSHKFDDTLFPKDHDSLNGIVYKGEYTTNAWLGDNVDEDEKAIVVYQDSAFLDPGVALTDALGRPVRIGEETDADNDGAGGIVERSLVLRTEEKGLYVTGIGDGVGQTVWYARNEEGKGYLTTDESKRWETLSQPDGSDQIDLRGLKVLPGIYTLEYRYTDPVTGRIYDFEETNFDTDEGRAGAKYFHRTVVILPTPGDVDMDGAVTSADAVALRNSLGTTTATNHVTINGKDLTADATAALFAYRVCDVDQSGDGPTTKDVDTLEQVPYPRLVVVGEEITYSEYYYIPLPTGEEEAYHVRKPLVTNEDATGATISLVYLGKERNKIQSGGNTVDPQGPWTVTIPKDENGEPQKDSEGYPLAGVKLGETFWVGVKLNNGKASSALSVDAATFTFSLGYDARYVKPAVVLSSAQLETLNLSGMDPWEGMMRLYNLGKDAKTVWAGNGPTGSVYKFTAAAGYDKEFTDHYSRAQTPLEINKKIESKLRELTFSVKTTDENNVVHLNAEAGEVWLFAVPFTLVSHPYNQTEARLVELEAGMNTFTVVGRKGAAGDGISVPAAAYSTQDAIFGGATKNLATDVTYTSAGGAVLLGKDLTEVNYIHNEYGNLGTASTTNAMYSNPFYAQHYRDKDGTIRELPFRGRVEGEMPSWLSYKDSELSGFPTEAGVYNFSIGGEPFRLIVDKAPLHFWTDNQGSYYGQPEFRGEAAKDFIFHYNKEEIQSLDKDRISDWAGYDDDGNALKALLDGYGYSEPTFAAMTTSGIAADHHTDVGLYPIQCRLYPTADNYEFYYLDDSRLEILRRPFWVTQIAAGTNVGEVYSDRGPLYLVNLTAKLGGGNHGFEVHLPMRTPEGLYNYYPLTGDVMVEGDVLRINYTGEYIQRGKDGTGGQFFVLEEGNISELRDIRVGYVNVIGGTNYQNYRLISATPTRDAANETTGVVGTVIRRNVRALHIDQVPSLTYQFGRSLTTWNELHYYLLMDGEQQEGIYAYNPNIGAEFGISVVWVTEEEIAKAEADAAQGNVHTVEGLPFRGTGYRGSNIFTMDYNGRYLCMSVVTADENGEPKLIYTKWDVPLTITPLAVTLTATPVNRFYGEKNPDLTFTYDASQLSFQDQQWIRETFGGNTFGQRDSNELAELLVDQGYSRPKLRAQVSADDLTIVDERTNYTGATNLVWIGKAGCKSGNYVFQYAYIDSSGTINIQKDWGGSPLKINKRNIVVDGLTTTDILSTIYADTRRLYKKNQVLKLSDVVIGLPEHDSQTNRYYTRSNTPVLSVEQLGYETETGVVNGDELSFTYTATVVPTDGNAYKYYTNFAKGYFNMKGVEDYKLYPVQVGDLVLTGKDANNYRLVFRDPSSAIIGHPAQIAVVWECVEPERASLINYYVPKILDPATGQPLQREEPSDSPNLKDEEARNSVLAMGKVQLRPIERMSLLHTGRMEYTYGDLYNPRQGGDGCMSLSIQYASDPEIENYPNLTTDIVELQISTWEDGRPVTSFDDRSLVIHRLQEGQSLESLKNDPDALAASVLKYYDVVSVTKDDGARIFVTGQRGGQEEMIFSEVSTKALSVKPRTLTLKGGDQKRSYGEQDGAYTFIVKRTELAPQDQKLLEESGRTGADGDGDLRYLAAERGFAYTEPDITTTAGPGSDVIDGGQKGYPIQVSGGTLENYVFRYEPGTLYIYPRVVQVDKFISGENNPLYSIYSNTRARVFNTNLSNHPAQISATVSEASFTMALSTSVHTFADGTRSIIDLPVTGSAVYKDAVTGVEDEIIVKAQVEFHLLAQNADLSKLNETCTVRVNRVELAPESAQNYVLLTNKGAWEATGLIQLRGIDKIRFARGQEPAYLDYTYGETLNLSDMIISIDYSSANDGTRITEEVRFLGTENFAQKGLYVNYYDYDKLGKPAKSEWDTIRKTNYTATTGDHLTIAPTHDPAAAQKGFVAANGMHLIITAELNEENPPEPLIVQRPITVKPLDLQFSLFAEDKTYDGTTEAAGSITFTNVYSGNGITDLVYPVIGADYEKNWSSLASGSESFAAYLKENGGYTFSTGSYVPADPEPWGENHALAWTEGYAYDRAGTLRFEYEDANVAYRQTPTAHNYGELDTIPVKLSGLRLAGPDAANYRIIGITTNSGTLGTLDQNRVGGAIGYLGSTLPQATIHKANRPALSTTELPQVEIDSTTNAIRVLYDRSLSENEMTESADHIDELHYEYALQYMTNMPGNSSEPETPEDPDQSEESAMSRENETTLVVAQWAGRDGSGTWDDGRYFGGEAVTPGVPEGYLPKEDDLPKAENIKEDTPPKGQLYPWDKEDDGFTLDLSAYPGGGQYEQALLNYYLYRTDREPLPRDTSFLAVLRVAETHNYNASSALTSVAGYDHQTVQAVLDAWAALEDPDSAEAQAAAQQALLDASQAALAVSDGALAAALAEAEAVALEEALRMDQIAEEKKWPEDWTERAPASAVKTYRQRLETVSVKELESADAVAKGEKLPVPTLEAVRFTDVIEYPDEELMNAVLRNYDPKRYYSYAWDSAQSVKLDFEEGLSLEEPISITLENKDGKPNETLLVNVGNTARIYVDVKGNSGSNDYPVTEIFINQGDVSATLGDKPVKLTITYLPGWVLRPSINWTSSDPSVATVNRRGEVTFVGAGTAIITAAVAGHEDVFDSIVVTVKGEELPEELPDGIFNHGLLDAFFAADEDMYFHPRQKMTRGEAALLLEKFYLENENWTRTGPEDFPDLTGEEDYAGAARKLSSKGVMIGLPDGTFGGDQVITRAEFIALLARMIGEEIPDTTGQRHTFRDVGEEDTWAYREIDAMSRLPGVIQGVGEDYFAPSRGITRAEAASFLTRLLQFPEVSGDPLIPRDVDSDHWARNAILRAVNRESGIAEDSPF